MENVINNATVLGEIVWVMSHSKLHSEWELASIHKWVVPAMVHQQFRLYKENDKPVAFVSWAYLSQRAENAYVRNTRALTADDWKSGDRGWIMDFVAPFGHAKQMSRDLKYNIFVNDVGRSLRWREGSDTLTINYLHGAKAIDKAQDRTISTTVELM